MDVCASLDDSEIANKQNRREAARQISTESLSRWSFRARLSPASLFTESSGMAVGSHIGGSVAAHGAGASDRGTEPRARFGASFGSRTAVRLGRIREGAASASDPEHEPAGESVRQCQL